MTRLEARIKDFHLVKENKNIMAYRFRFGQCKDFHDAMNQFKKRIPFEDRTPFPEAGWLWEVRATIINQKVLEDIFDNFSENLITAESQMELWG